MQIWAANSSDGVRCGKTTTTGRSVLQGCFVFILKGMDDEGNGKGKRGSWAEEEEVEEEEEEEEEGEVSAKEM